MLERLSSAQFTELLHTKFRLHAADERTLDLELIEVNDNSPSPDNEVFSLILLGPPLVFAPQGTYRFVHDQLGAIELFVVPVGKTEEGFRYEVVFNLISEPEEKTETSS